MILMTQSFVGSIVLSLLVSACAINVNADNEAMFIMSSQLTKLSAAVESTVRYKNPPADLDEQGLLVLSTQHDTQLLDNFSGFKVRALSKERHSVVLICTVDGLRGLLEDAECTPPLDRHHWKDSPNQPCEFTVETVTACPAP